MDDFYKPKFKKGDKVYYKPQEADNMTIKSFGLDAPGTLKKIEGIPYRVQKDTPYTVVECRPKSKAWLCLSLELPDGRTPAFDPDDFISEDEYFGREPKKEEVKDANDFQIGDTVYFTGGYKSFFLKGNGSYEVAYVDKTQLGLKGIENIFFSKKDFSKKDENKNYSEKPSLKHGDIIYYVGDKDNNLKKNTPYVLDFIGPHVITIQGNNNMFRRVDFISAVEWKSKKPSHNFKPGDTVYYDGIKREFEYHHPYTLYGYASNTDDFYGIYVKSELKPISRTIVNIDFISIDEYKKKYGVEDSSSKLVANFMDFVKNFKSGDIVYYMGDKIKKFKADTPYKVEFYNPNTKVIKIEGDICPSEDFVSEEEYKRINKQSEETSAEEGKSETRIKLQLYSDTKKDKIKWEKPYVGRDNWFRTIIKLEKPTGAFLRFDLINTVGKWELSIYYHRKGESSGPADNSIKIHHFEETTISAAIARRVQDQLAESLKKKQVKKEFTDVDDYEINYPPNSEDDYMVLYDSEIPY